MKKINWEINQDSRKTSLFQKIKWYEVGGMASLLVLMYSSQLFLFKDLTLEAILVFNFFALLVHQFEEYGYPGWFPGMLNRRIFDSKYPLHYPLNRRNAWVINVMYGWTLYIASIVFIDRFPALGMACILVSGGNVLAHIGFSIKTRKPYNPGLLTSIVLFAPVVILYFVYMDPVLSYGDRSFWNGILLGVIANAMIPFLVLILASENSPFEFGARHEVPQFRKFKGYKVD